MAAQRFMDQLPRIAVSDLQGETTCHICMEPFNNNAAAADDTEPAVRLPCSHIMGRNCIARWLATTNSCPLCRCTFVDPSSPSPRRQSSRDDLAVETVRAENSMAEHHALMQQMALMQAEGLEHLEGLSAQMMMATREMEEWNQRSQERLEALVGPLGE